MVWAANKREIENVICGWHHTKCWRNHVWNNSVAIIISCLGLFRPHALISLPATAGSYGSQKPSISMVRFLIINLCLSSLFCSSSLTIYYCQSVIFQNISIHYYYTRWFNEWLSHVEPSFKHHFQVPPYLFIIIILCTWLRFWNIYIYTIICIFMYV